MPGLLSGNNVAAGRLFYVVDVVTASIIDA